jgi:hypothetical protein
VRIEDEEEGDVEMRMRGKKWDSMWRRHHDSPKKESAENRTGTHECGTLAELYDAA